MDCHIENIKFELWHSTEILVKQFLFTEGEIEEDLNFQKKII